MGKRVSINISKNRCKGCGLCVEICPQSALNMSNFFNKSGYHFVECSSDGCKGCKKCAIICPDAAIEIFVVEEESYSGNKTGG